MHFQALLEQYLLRVRDLLHHERALRERGSLQLRGSQLREKRVNRQRRHRRDDD
jgi:hypothetical protein